MTDFTHVGSLPRHLYAFVDRSFIRKGGSGFEPCVWFGLVSHPGRAWGLTVMLGCGAVYRALPPHAIAFQTEVKPWLVTQAQRWDCYGTRFTTIEYPYLTGLGLLARVSPPVFDEDDEDRGGDYLFTAAPIGDGFSQEPGQAKEFVFCKLDNGRLTIQPTNHVLFEERSFTDATGWPTDLTRSETIWSCEE